MFFEPEEEERKRKKKDYINPLVEINSSDEDQWLVCKFFDNLFRFKIKNYRFPKAGITFLCNWLSEDLMPMDGGRGKPIDAEIQVGLK